jgi:hypothetical protein
MSEAIKPDSGLARDRIAEISEVLAAGLSRILARKSSGLVAEGGESSLDISPVQSGHPTRENRRNPDG